MPITNVSRHITIDGEVVIHGSMTLLSIFKIFDENSVVHRFGISEPNNVPMRQMDPPVSNLMTKFYTKRLYSSKFTNFRIQF